MYYLFMYFLSINFVVVVITLLLLLFELQVLIFQFLSFLSLFLQERNLRDVHGHTQHACISSGAAADATATATGVAPIVVPCYMWTVRSTSDAL